MKAAIEAIERLVKIEETESPSDDELVGIPVEEPPENHSEHASETVNDDGTYFSEDSLMLEENAATTGALEVSIGKGNANLNAELNHAGQSPDLLKDKGSINNGTTCLTDVFGNMEDVESGNAAYDRFHFDQETILPHLLFSETVDEASEVGLPTESKEMMLPGSEVVSGEDPASLQGHDSIPAAFFLNSRTDSVKNK